MIFVTGATINGEKSNPTSLGAKGIASRSSPYFMRRTSIGLNLSAESYPLDISLINLQGRELWRLDNVTGPQVIPTWIVPKTASIAVLQSRGKNAESFRLPVHPDFP